VKTITSWCSTSPALRPSWPPLHISQHLRGHPGQGGSEHVDEMSLDGRILSRGKL